MEPGQNESFEKDLAPKRRRLEIRDATGKIDWMHLFWLGCELYAYLVLIACVAGIVLTRPTP